MRIDLRRLEILSLEQNAPIDAGVRDDFVGAVEATQKRCLAATRRTDKRRDLPLKDLQRDILQGFLMSIPKADVLDAEGGWVRAVVIRGRPQMQSLAFGFVQHAGEPCSDLNNSRFLYVEARDAHLDRRCIFRVNTL